MGEMGEARGEGLLAHAQKPGVQAKGNEKSQAVLCDQVMGSEYLRIPFILKIQYLSQLSTPMFYESL